jgi:hypothetical protein
MASLDKFAQLLETEHLLGERIFEIGAGIAQGLATLVDPQIPSTGYRTLAASAVPAGLSEACALFVHLLDHFADPVHLQAEEAAADYAIGCGLPRAETEWVFAQHEQARAYWAGITLAWERMGGADDGDRYYAAMDLRRLAEAFVFLFKAHAVRENNEFYVQASNVIDPATDALVLNIIQHSGPSDITPYFGMVTRAEKLLGITPPPGSPTA